MSHIELIRTQDIDYYQSCKYLSCKTMSHIELIRNPRYRLLSKL